MAVAPDVSTLMPWVAVQAELVSEIDRRLDADADKDNIGRYDRSVVQFDSACGRLLDGSTAHDLHAPGRVKLSRISAQCRRSDLGQHRSFLLEDDDMAATGHRRGGDLEADDAAANENDIPARLQRTPQCQRIVHAAEIADRQRATLEFRHPAGARTCRQQQPIECKDLPSSSPISRRSISAVTTREDVDRVTSSSAQSPAARMKAGLGSLSSRIDFDSCGRS